MKQFFLKLRNLIFIILFLVILVGLVYRVFEDYKRYQLLKNEFLKLVQKEKQLKEEIKNLEMIKKESNVIERLERQARLMLGFKKEGEEVIVVVPPTNSSLNQPNSTTTNETLQLKSFSNLLSRIKNIWYNILRVIK